MSPSTSPSTRVLIYAHGTPDEITAQQHACQQKTESAGELVSAVASDPPDGCRGWLSAHALLAAGVIDRILFTSRRVIPREVGSITQDCSNRSGRRPRRLR